jgi:hypothetical protein
MCGMVVARVPVWLACEDIGIRVGVWVIQQGLQPDYVISPTEQIQDIDVNSTSSVNSPKRCSKTRTLMLGTAAIKALP